MRRLPETGFVRLNEILKYIPMGRTSWWNGVKEGHFPQPTKLGPRTTAWRCEDIHDFIAYPENYIKKKKEQEIDK